jgi:hypothetical protein
MLCTRTRPYAAIVLWGPSKAPWWRGRMLAMPGVPQPGGGVDRLDQWTLQEPNAELRFGRDGNTRLYDRIRRVASLVRDYVIVIRLKWTTVAQSAKAFGGYPINPRQNKREPKVGSLKIRNR